MDRPWRGSRSTSATTTPRCSGRTAPETALGVQLVERATRPAQLTEAGSALARHVRSVIARLDNAEQEIAKIAHRRHGRLRFGSFPTALATFVPRVLARFQQREPDVSLTVIDDHLQRLLPRLHDGQLDLSPRAPAVGPHSVSPAWVSPVRMR